MDTQLTSTIDRLLTAVEVADVLRVSKMTVYRLIQRDELAAIRVGKSYRIRQSDLLAYLEAGTALPSGIDPAANS